MSSPCLTTREVHLEKQENSELLRELPIISPYPLQPSTNRTYKAPKNKTEEEQADSGYPLPSQSFFHQQCVVGARNGDLLDWNPSHRGQFWNVWGHVLFLKSDLWLFICVYICVYICICIIWEYTLSFHIPRNMLCFHPSGILFGWGRTYWRWFTFTHLANLAMDESGWSKSTPGKLVTNQQKHIISRI